MLNWDELAREFDALDAEIDAREDAGEDCAAMNARWAEIRDLVLRSPAPTMSALLLKLKVYGRSQGEHWASIRAGEPSGADPGWLGIIDDAARCAAVSAGRER